MESEDCRQQLINTLSEMNKMISLKKKFKIYDNFYDLVLREGRSFTPRKKPRDVRFGKVKECFMNAANLVLDRKDLFYVEGYASIRLVGGLPFYHGWCVDQEGYVIDPTWREVGTAYHGVVLTTNYLRKMLLKTEHYGLLDYPNLDLLEEGFPEGAIQDLGTAITR